MLCVYALLSCGNVSTNSVSALKKYLDTFEENLSILNNFELPVKKSDFLLFKLLFDRLDTSTATAFQVVHGSSLVLDIDSYDILLNFSQFAHCA